MTNKESNRKRKHRIVIRMNDTEYEKLLTKIGKITRVTSRQQILIDLIFKGKVITKTDNQVEAEVALEKALRSIETELIHEGRNLNQLTKKVNEAGLNFISATSLKTELNKISKSLEDISNGVDQIRNRKV